MARDSAVPRSDVLDKTELLIVLPTGLVAQGQNRLFLAGFDFARCLLWFQPLTRNHSCQGVSFLASALCLEVPDWFQLRLNKIGPGSEARTGCVSGFSPVALIPHHAITKGREVV